MPKKTVRKPKAFDWKKISMRPVNMVIGIGEGKGGLSGNITAHTFYEVEYYRRERAGKHIEMKTVLERGGDIWTFNQKSPIPAMMMAIANLIKEVQYDCIQNDIQEGMYKLPKKERRR